MSCAQKVEAKNEEEIETGEGEEHAPVDVYYHFLRALPFHQRTWHSSYLEAKERHVKCQQPHVITRDYREEASERRHGNADGRESHDPRGMPSIVARRRRRPESQGR